MAGSVRAPLTKMLLATAAMVGLAASSSSCRIKAQNNESIFIRTIQAAQAPDCTAKPDPNGVFLARGTLDVGVRSRYFAFVLVGNQLVARGDFKLARAESNRVTLTGADVHLLDDQLKEIAFYSVVALGTVDPTTSSDPGYGLASVEVIPSGAIDAIKGTVVHSNTVRTFYAKLRVFGSTLGGTDVESGDFTFPIDVCFGCSVIFTPESNDTTIGPGTTPNCRGKVASATTTTGQTQACFFGQDGFIQCNVCQGLQVCTPCAFDCGKDGLGAPVVPCGNDLCDTKNGYSCDGKHCI